MFIGTSLFVLQGFAEKRKSIAETEKLATIAKIWGFLKYYHPQVAAGKFDWDGQLLEMLPKIDSAGTKDELSAVYIEWIDGLGEVKQCKKRLRSKQEYFDKNFDLSWMNDSAVFTAVLSERLRFIERNRFQGTGHYASAKNVGIAGLTNEAQYKDFEYPEEPYRLLCLFKFWNVIEYFFPYKYMTDQPWSEVLVEMIPKFKYAGDTTAYHLAMLELVVKINDSHGGFATKYTNAYFGKYWIPVKFKLIDNKAIIVGFYNDSLAGLDDLRVGDVISLVNGQKISSVLSEKLKYINASNTAVKLRNAVYAIFNGNSDSLTITFERDGAVETKQIRRYPFNEFRYLKEIGKNKWHMMEGNIGYVNMGVLENKDVSEMMDSLMHCRALIFDIRNYPRGTMYSISRYLNPLPKDFVKFTKPDFSYPGKYTWTRNLKCGKKNKDHFKGKVILLVDELTQSHAEFTCMCFQTAENVTIIGSQTAGADGNVSFVKLVGEYKTMISGIGVYFPDGRETQRVGIVPDIIVKPTIQGLRQGRDEVLEMAIKVIGQ